jgi:hypothetical protein
MKIKYNNNNENDDDISDEDYNIYFFKYPINCFSKHYVILIKQN